MKPIDGLICECVVLDGHKGKMTSNSNDPPNSFHTKDLFIAHPSIPNAWKFVGRLDDRVTLTNGEKVLPLPIEGRIQQDPLVKEAVVFGIDRPVPGLLLFRAVAAKGLSDEEFLNQVWPAVEDANSRAEGFSQISREMVAVIAEDVECPTTDKSSIKRAQVYREFAKVIDDAYVRLENSQEGTLVLDGEALESWIINSFEKLGVRLENAKEDFFSAGVDSLKAMQMRGLMIRNLDLGGNASKCPSMIVYDSGTTEKLAKTLPDIRSGSVGVNRHVDEVSEMVQLIDQWSQFIEREPANEEAPESNVVVCDLPLGMSVYANLAFSCSLAQLVLWALTFCLTSLSFQASPKSTARSASRHKIKQQLTGSKKPFKNEISAISSHRQKSTLSKPTSQNKISAYRLQYSSKSRLKQHT